jgi:hypothetical protein
MAGYSGTSLAKKLGIKDDFKIRFIDLPAEVKKELNEALATCLMPGKGPFDFIHIFSESKSALRKHFSRLSSQLESNGMMWISWPKKSSGVATDLTEDEVRKMGLELGLVDVKVCAVTDTWSGLKFVIRLKDRRAKH